MVCSVDVGAAAEQYSCDQRRFEEVELQGLLGNVNRDHVRRTCDPREDAGGGRMQLVHLIKITSALS